MPELDPIAAQFRAERIARGLTQQELSKRSGVCQSTICQSETGRRGMNMHTVRSLAAAFGLDVVLVRRADE